MSFFLELTTSPSFFRCCPTQQSLSKPILKRLDRHKTWKIVKVYVDEDWKSILYSGECIECILTRTKNNKGQLARHLSETLYNYTMRSSPDSHSIQFRLIGKDIGIGWPQVWEGYTALAYNTASVVHKYMDRSNILFTIIIYIIHSYGDCLLDRYKDRKRQLN